MDEELDTNREKERGRFLETTSSQPSNISPVSSEIFVYGKVMREPDRSVPNNMLPKFISTQKVTHGLYGVLF